MHSPEGFGHRARGDPRVAVAFCGAILLKTNVYVDGFNLYYGLLKSSPHRWLDLQRFCETLLVKNEINRILYFTAKLDARPHNPDQPTRQLAYLRALATLPKVEIYFGNFLTSVVRQPLVQVDPTTGGWLKDRDGRPVLKTDRCGQVLTAFVLKTEEKGSDVNLAAHLLKDAHTNDCECAVIASNDSDLLTPIRLAKQECGLKIGLIPPRKKGSHELKRLADFVVDPRRHYLETAQFPQSFADQHGIITKPLEW